MVFAWPIGVQEEEGTPLLNHLADKFLFVVTNLKLVLVSLHTRTFVMTDCESNIIQGFTAITTHSKRVCDAAVEF
jgi:hypothetical protein